MNLMDKLKYDPKEGDLLLFPNGSYQEIVEKLRADRVKVRDSEFDDFLSRPAAKIREQLIKGDCYLCRKSNKEC